MRNLLHLKTFDHFPKSNLLLKMKLTTFLLLMGLLQVSANSFAQRITLSEKNASLEQVLKKVKTQTGYDILYQDKIIKKAHPIDINIQNASIPEALSELLKGQELTYTVNQKTIVIKEKEKGILELSVANMALIDIAGSVKSQSGVPVAGATIQVKGKSPVYTDVAGKFQLWKADGKSTVLISCLGYKSREMTVAELSLKKDITLLTENQVIDETIVQAKSPAGTKIDLKYRQHLNLSQVLQGTIPGLIIKSETTSTDKVMIDSRKAFGNLDGFKHGLYTLEDARLAWNEWAAAQSAPTAQYNTSEEWLLQIRRNESRLNANGALVRSKEYSNSGLVPELRGAGGFPGSGSGMLIVIDGFVQSSFPADYPMNNVASIEVVKDPAETIKWGPEGLNGVILITTTRSTSNKVDVSYSTNFNFSKPTDYSSVALKRPSTTQLLDYYMEAADKNLYSFTKDQMPLSSPAMILLYQRAHGTAAEKVLFQQKWDSLASISHIDQSTLLQQNRFLQNHNLRLSGGIADFHRFTINGIYGTSRTEALGNKTRNLGLNMSNQFSVMKNKLQINWILNTSQNKTKTGTSYDLDRLEPYQRIYTPDGGYTYDFTSGPFTQDQNAKLLASGLGYVNSGSNPLEDALANRSHSTRNSINNQLNLDWKIQPELSFSTSFLFSKERLNNNDILDWSSSQVRRQYNQYVGYNKTTNEATFFIPQGAVRNDSKSGTESYNLRSGFSYRKAFAEKHLVEGSIGFAAFRSTNDFSPYPARYGYNIATGESVPIDLSELLISQYDYFGLPVYPNQLLTVYSTDNKVQNRNLSLNTKVNYTFDNRYKFESYYNESFMPVNTAADYTSTRNMNALASWFVNKERFLDVPWLSNLRLSVGAGEIKMASLPVQIAASRSLQAEWKTRSVTVQSYNPIRQNGQRVTNYDALFDLGVSENRFQIQLNYRRNSLGRKNQLSGRALYHISQEPFFKVPFISNLVLEGVVTSMSPGQAISQMMGTNTPMSGGGYVPTTGNMSLGTLPPDVLNKELHINLGFFNNRLNIDLRRYARTTSGLGNGIMSADPSTGFLTKPRYSEITNQGWEVYLKGDIIKNETFGWTATINGAYNENLVHKVEKDNFRNSQVYLIASREGYSTDNLWSYRWAGLNDKGAPMVFNENNEPVEARTGAAEWKTSNDLWLEYSGRTIAPWNGAILQDIHYKGVFFRATVLGAFGHVMRKYSPVASGTLDNHELIDQRWRKAGDELTTEIAAMATNDALRTLAIKYSNNSIVRADFIRLQEVMLGYDLPQGILNSNRVKNLWISFQLQNLGLLWRKNKLGMDPIATARDGRPMAKAPLNYGLAINITF